MPALRVSQRVAESIILPDGGKAAVSQLLSEVLMTYTAPASTTVTGAGVSQRLAEVLLLNTDPAVRVSQRCVEVLFTAATTGEGGAVGGGSSTISYGYAV